MAHLTWAADTAVNATNLNKLTQNDDLEPTASTFNGSTGRTLTHNKGTLNYMVIVNPKADPGGTLGEVWYSKALNTVTIYNSGSFTGAFDYIVIPYD